jgi:hypothetical protein
MITFITTLVPAILCLVATYTGLQVIEKYKNMWDFQLNKKLSDSAGWYITVCLSTASSLGLGILLLGWSFQFTGKELSFFHNLTFNINHTVTALSVIMYHHFADKKLQEHKE